MLATSCNSVKLNKNRVYNVDDELAGIICEALNVGVDDCDAPTAARPQAAAADPQLESFYFRKGLRVGQDGGPGADGRGVLYGRMEEFAAAQGGGGSA